ncbi:hypothetical protein [Flavobacterium laiguense]|uniref:DUF1640 domain-containing protein n=1 Tax=Flavobacterium laiguense TaxID=2169409 RepID=A0A2U1JYI6_9FLAO|nr:hypothetical protein [Flavobacterium laiguense]PWA09833.1 hypothetical protein DB891_06570 [Flavobacterium laiguense]
MSSVNLTLYTLFTHKLKLSEADAKDFMDAIKEEVRNDIKYENSDFKSAIREDFLKLELKMEQNKSELKNEIKDSFKWFIGMFITIVLMMMGLYATILLK